MNRVAPVLPVKSVRAALTRYRALGFEGHAYRENDGDEPIYGFLNLGTAELHLSLCRELDAKTTTSACYLYVDDANALYAKWRASGVEGKFHDPEDTPYDLREFGYVDPDGNLLRVGSQLPGK